MTCHRCGQPMYQHEATADRWWCRCGAWRDVGESADRVAAREAETASVLALLDAAIAGRRSGGEEQRIRDREITDQMEITMSPRIQTTGCPKCGGTMYKTIETDENGNPIGAGPFVCNSCGHMM
ncbi:hypothetical protein ACGFXC_09370 [Streptomyces sp. NPDC048507]|uniref:hypothetical protein n=1 Tax=Streptomyces sp. NPDC048507 TaxID=3365560 RepID=UPI003723B3B2